MTDEDQQKLCEDLRLINHHGWTGRVCGKAANEIERQAHIIKEARKLLGENFEKLEHRVSELERTRAW